MSDVRDDGNEELSDVLWDLHFMTKRIVDGVVGGVYSFSTQDIITMEYERKTVPPGKQHGCKVKASNYT